MNDLTTTPTAELLAEWGKIKKDDLVIEDVCLRWNAIAAELDRRCDNLVENNNGKPKIHITGDKTTHHDNGHLIAVTFGVPLEELRDLLTWLLLKGGNG